MHDLCVALVADGIAVGRGTRDAPRRVRTAPGRLSTMAAVPMSAACGTDGERKCVEPQGKGDDGADRWWIGLSRSALDCTGRHGHSKPIAARTVFRNGSLSDETVVTLMVGSSRVSFRRFF